MLITISRPIEGETIATASDFGFAVDDHGGTYVCSMAGPETGGFAGFRVMLVEGPVSRGSLEIHEREMSFSGFATVALIPGSMAPARRFSTASSTQSPHGRG